MKAAARLKEKGAEAEMKKTGVKLIKIYVTLIIFFVASLYLITLFPNEWMQDAADSINQMWEQETLAGCTSPLFWQDQSRMDTWTDMVMYERLGVPEGETMLGAAMNQRGYPRYWHGYLIILKPLSIFFSYAELRYLNMFVINLLFFLSALKLHTVVKRKEITCAYVCAVTGCFVIVAPANFQYMASFAGCFLMVLAVLADHKEGREGAHLPEIFFTGGMLINFFDFLTFPLVTLGVPLICLLLLELQKKDNGVWKAFLKTVQYSVLWGAGYSVCWITKWLLASAVLKKNVLLDAKNQAILRMVGSETEPEPVNHIQTVLDNVRLLFFFDGNFKNGIIIGVIVGLILVSLVLLWRADRYKAGIYMLILLVSAYPYIWYLVFSNHSQRHTYFTYRTQLIAVFGVLAVAFGAPLEVARMRKRMEKTQGHD